MPHTKIEWLTPTRNNKMARMYRRGTPPTLLVGLQIGTATTAGSQKTKQRNTTGPSNSTSGNLPKENKYSNLKRYMHCYVYWGIMYNSQGMDTACVH